MSTADRLATVHFEDLNLRVEGLEMGRTLRVELGTGGAPATARVVAPCPLCAAQVEAAGAVCYRSAYDDMSGTEGYFHMVKRAPCPSCGALLVFGVELTVVLSARDRRRRRTELTRVFVNRAPGQR